MPATPFVLDPTPTAQDEGMMKRNVQRIVKAETSISSDLLWLCQLASRQAPAETFAAEDDFS